MRVWQSKNTMVGPDVAEWRAWYGTVRSSRGKVALMSLSIWGQWKETRENVRAEIDGKRHYDWEWNEGVSIIHEPEWMMVPKNYSNRVELLGFSYGRFDRRGGYYVGRALNEASVIKLVLVPWPAVIVMFGIGPLWRVSKQARRKWRRNRRLAMGHCGECGYDLRGSTGGCPECGGSGMLKHALPAEGGGA